ncbi:MAG: hypothetical protein M0Z71_10105 [Nitrospiraceae bacterium]|nr:hypothetical protein [Nitrospiraceae bacterium]
MKRATFSQSYEIHNFRFSLATDCEELKSGLGLLYPAMAAKSGICSAGWTVQCFWNHGRGVRAYRIYEADTLIFETDDTVQLWDNLEWAIMARILQNTRHLIQLHASGVDVDGQAILLVGPSGSGKSSLALGMLLQGWKCLSDEVILIEPGENRAVPLPRSFHVDSRALGLFPDLAVKLNEAVCMEGRGKMRFDPALIRNGWVARSSVPAWLVFPCYKSGNRNDLIPVGETEAMTLLIGQTINLLDHGERGLETLLQLVKNCRCFRFNTGDMHEASLAMSQLIRQQPPLALCRDQRAGAGAELVYQN